MTPLEFVAAAFASAVGAGLLGSVLGLGGGVLLVPVLTLGLHVDIRYAIGASILSVIATSSGTAAFYLKARLTNVRLATFLELATTLGAITGAVLAGAISGRWLFVAFGAAMLLSAVAVLALRRERRPPEPDPLADLLKLHGSYRDGRTGDEVSYRVARPLTGLSLMYVAGALSGLLGIGSGTLKVPAMDVGMRLPLKVSAATSSFMIGVTGAASAVVFFARGDIDPFLAGPVCFGVVLGSGLGARALPRLPAPLLRVLLVTVLLGTAVQMLWRGVAG
ncbi:MAG: sulfite exporter TauE/SafE family protein [Myxococcales bacterium]